MIIQVRSFIRRKLAFQFLTQKDILQPFLSWIKLIRDLVKSAKAGLALAK